MTGFNTTQFNSEEGANPEKNDDSMNPAKIINFNFAGDFTEQEKIIFMSIQELDLRKLCFFLNTDITQVSGMTYNVYDTAEDKQSADPQHSISRASARFKEYAIYRFWKAPEDMHFPHEMTHLAAHRWAQSYELTTDLDTADGNNIVKTIDMVSTSFMQEGLAIAVDDMLFNRQLPEKGQLKFIDDYCRDQKDSLPTSLNNVVNLDGFGSIPNEVVVPFTASFSKFLIRKYGIKRYKEAYTSMKEILSSKENVEIIEKVYGETEINLLTAWKKSLGIE